MDASKASEEPLYKAIDHYESEKQLLKYEYSELVGEDIRIATLLPGQNPDPIRITISDEPLIPPDKGPQPPELWTKEELQERLPESWGVHRTLDEAFLFENEKTHETFWTHPDASIEKQHYQLPDDYPYPEFEPKYEALSYAWGDLEQRATLYVRTPAEIRTLGIGHNLAIALQHLRYTDKPRSLWIDAICINQEDLDERSRQVQRMASIYRMAYRVLVWLGPATPYDKLTLSTIAKLGAQVECCDDLSAYFNLPEKADQELARDELFRSLRGEEWDAIDHLLQREWFARL